MASLMASLSVEPAANSLSSMKIGESGFLTTLAPDLEQGSSLALSVNILQTWRHDGCN